MLCGLNANTSSKLYGLFRWDGINKCFKWNFTYSYFWDNGSTTSTIVGLFAGSYSVTVIDSNGCQITDSVHVQKVIVFLFSHQSYQT